MIESGSLTAHHDVTSFRCGKPSLDAWLNDLAMRAQLQGTAWTTVWTDQPSDVIVAYYSVAPVLVLRQDVSRRLSGGVSQVPGYLVARLALDQSLHGQGLGGELLVDALETVCRAADAGGGRLVVVDPLDEEAATFYDRFGFLQVERSMRRFMLIKDARASIERRR